MQNFTDLGILAQVSDAQAIAFNLPHQATALKKQALDKNLAKISKKIEWTRKDVIYFKTAVTIISISVLGESYSNNHDFLYQLHLATGL